MLVLVNKKGEVAAYSGGTSPGAGAVILQTSATLATAGSIAYTGHAIEQGLEKAKISGIPSAFNLNGHVSTSHSVQIINH